MLLQVLPSENIHEVVLPDLFIQDMEVVGSIIDRGIPLLYKLENEGRKIVVSARSYHEDKNTVLLPRELMRLLSIENGLSSVKCSRHIANLPTLTGIIVTPRNTDFYRSLDIRSLIEHRLLNVSVIHTGLQLILREGTLCHHVEVAGLLTDSGKIVCGEAMVSAEREVILDFSQNDELLSQFMEEERPKNEERKILSRIESFDKIQARRLSGKVVFGLSKEFYSYIAARTPERKEEHISFVGAGRTTGK
jgi:hypothetical protein